MSPRFFLQDDSAHNCVDTRGMACRVLLALSLLWGLHMTTTAATSCGGIVDHAIGVIASPNFPTNYDNNAYCEWVITAPAGKKIRLTSSAFKLENHPACVFDSLELFDGEVSMGKVCGLTTISFLSRSNALRLVFKTNDRVQYPGFSLDYSFDCGVTGGEGLFLGKRGTLSSLSPSSSRRPGSTDNLWYIIVPEDHTLTFQVSPSDLQGNASCLKDYLSIKEILSNGSLLSKELHCFPNSTPPQIRSEARTLQVYFRSDGNHSASGFSGNWTSDCGTVRRTPQGIVSSPMFPNFYNNDELCVWRIIAPVGHRINLTFHAFRLDPCFECSCDYLELFDVSRPGATSKGKFCGMSLPEVESQSHDVELVFKTNRGLRNKGFSASYVFVV